jgi:hypothetical protein
VSPSAVPVTVSKSAALSVSPGVVPPRSTITGPTAPA